MRNRRFFALLPGALVTLAWACSNHNNPNLCVGCNDGGADADIDAGDDAVDDLGGPGPDVVGTKCTLGDMVTDPVALCVQQQVLGEELQYYVKGQGIAPGWSSTGPAYAALPRTSTSWQDDLGLAGALGAYYCSAEVYGNTQSNDQFIATLIDLGGVLNPELQQALVTGYDGETYFRLRWAQAAYNYANDAEATMLSGMANAYAASIAGQVYPVPAGADGGSPGGMVIGTKNADGSVTYAPAQTVMAAAALLDIATLEETGADAGASPAWAGIAQEVLNYVLARGRDPVSGLFYQSLTTSDVPGHDTVGVGTPTNDSMLTETQAWVTLGLARAQDRLTAFQAAAPDGGVEAGLPDGTVPLEPAYYVAANTLAGALATAGLFDGTTTPGTPPPVGALMEGVILSGQQLLTNKTTIGNAIMLGGFHRVAVSAGAPLAYELGEIRAALGGIAQGTSQIANTSLTTIVIQNGNTVQQAYLRAGSKAFGYAAAYSPGADPVAQGQEPGATNYRSDADHAMVEGFSQLWVGAANDARCAP
jgi:hypothetical protein